MSIGIINSPGISTTLLLDNVLKVFLSMRIRIYCILGVYEYGHYKHYENIIFNPIVYNECSKKYFGIISVCWNYIIAQLNVVKAMLRNRTDVDAYLFFIGGETQLLPIICAKVFGKKVTLLLANSILKTSLAKQDKLTVCLKILRETCLSLADKIIVYAPSLIQDFQLEPYRHKILIAHRHFLDFDTFTVTTPLPARPSLIGYIGRLSGEKGVQNFAQALPTILSDQEDLRVLIGGDGQLKETIEASLQEVGLTARVDLSGWLSHDELPRYLNQLRLLVLPSYTEGLPNIILEAMACGTPVLATPVGAIPDVIIDGKTGFIMENNSPECIAANVVRALSFPDLERIAEDGKRFVEENFTFEKTLENWKRILQDIE